MKSKSFNRYNSFVRSVSNLAKSQNADVNADFVLEGTIQNFNLTFDLSWKVLKDVLLENKGVLDFATGSPRDTLQTAYANKLIFDDDWLVMLRLRNQLAHDYDGKLAQANFDKINKVYYPLFCKLQDTLAQYFTDSDCKSIDSFSS